MLFEIDLANDMPIYEQIKGQIILAIANGSLKDGDDLPTVRQLADSLEINHMTVNKAYQELKKEGFLISNRREGTKVNSRVGELDTYYWKSLEIAISRGYLLARDKKKFRQKLDELLNKLEG